MQTDRENAVLHVLLVIGCLPLILMPVVVVGLVIHVAVQPDADPDAYPYSLDAAALPDDQCRRDDTGLGYTVIAADSDVRAAGPAGIDRNGKHIYRAPCHAIARWNCSGCYTVCSSRELNRSIFRCWVWEKEDCLFCWSRCC